MAEDETQELYLTSGESSSDFEEDDEPVSDKPPPEERSIVSSSSLHVLSEMKKTSVLLALIEDKEEKEPEKQKPKGKTIFFNRQPSKRNKQVNKEEATPLTPINGKSQPNDDDTNVAPRSYESSSDIPSTASDPSDSISNMELPTQKFIEESVPRDTRNRILSTLNSVIDIIDKDDTNKEHDETPSVNLVPFFQLPKVSTALKKGINLGYIMLSLYLLPVLPNVCGRDIWFLIKFVVSSIILILSMINARYTIDWVFPTVSISVAVLMLLYAYADGCLLYLYQLKRCLSPSKDNIGKSSCFTFYCQWYEIFRSLSAELLMYPLIVVCLFELLYIGTVDNIIVWVVFLVSMIYLILAVYIVRPVMLIMTIFRISKIADTTSRRSYTFLFVRFLFHVIGQTIVNVLCLVVIGIKLWEDSKTGNNWNEVSPFLWVIIAIGWILPLMSTLSFIAINYYWIQQISLEAFIDVIAYCEKPGFPEAIFNADKMEYNRFKQLVSYQSVRKDMIGRQRASMMDKIYTPFNVLFIVVYGIILNTVIIGFIVSLLLSFISGSLAAIIVSITASLIIILANIQFLFTFNLWLLVAMVIGPPLLIIWTVRSIKMTTGRDGRDYAAIN